MDEYGFCRRRTSTPARHRIESKPGLPHERYHAFLKSLGKFKEAQNEVNQARALDPLSLQVGIGEADIWYFQRDYDRAMLQYKKLLELIRISPRHMGTSPAYTPRKACTIRRWMKLRQPSS